MFASGYPIMNSFVYIWEDKTKSILLGYNSKLTKAGNSNLS